MYFAHGDEASHASETWAQSPTFGIVVVSLIGVALMLGIYWLLKKYTSWNFPTNNERKR